MRLAILASLVGLTTTLNAANYADAILNDNPVNYWRFDEQSGTTAAAAAGARDGEYQGGVTLGEPSAFPNMGSAIRLDGADGTHVFLGAPIHPGASITVEAWVNLDTDSATNFAPVIARWDGSYELDVNATTGDALNFVVRNDSNAFANGIGSTISRGAWHHVVGIFDGGTGTATSFLDGVAGTPETIGGVLQDAGGDDGFWYIGRTRTPSSGFGWDGLLDEVAIYDRALTQAEISAHIAAAQIPEPSAAFSLLFGCVLLIRRRR